LENVVYLDNNVRNPGEFKYILLPRTFLRSGGYTCRGDKPDTVSVKVNPEGKFIYIPQVITPDNGADQNNTWKIQWTEDTDPELYTIKLYNSSGALMHTMNPLVDTFDGSTSDKGYLPDGVYWYLLLDEAGEKVEAGGLTIRRQ
jgi:gliding motility-associated-like protein